MSSKILCKNAKMIAKYYFFYFLLTSKKICGILIWLTNSERYRSGVQAGHNEAEPPETSVKNTKHKRVSLSGEISKRSASRAPPVAEKARIAVRSGRKVASFRKETQKAFGHRKPDITRRSLAKHRRNNTKHKRVSLSGEISKRS